MKKVLLLCIIFFILIIIGTNCTDRKAAPSPGVIVAVNLKRGPVISCNPDGKEFGSVHFDIDYNEKINADFDLGLKLLHSFEYDEAEKAFAKIIDEAPDCAMAYWGVAMSNFHPLWTPPTPAEIQKGSKAIQIAQSLQTSEKEQDYINALAAFYTNWENTTHLERTLNFEKAMEKLHLKYLDDKEAGIFYALALVAAADPSDKSYAKQKKAGSILNFLYPDEPNHPGVAHYLIHTYDYPELAVLGLPAARKYASIAPASAHALHMPSHIFTRLGLWDECIASNSASVASAKCYAEAAGIRGHWDEELHGLDYLVYGYLQKGENDSAKRQLDYLATIKEVYPANFKVAYAFAAIPARFALENNNWEKASTLKVAPETFPWKDFPWQEAIVHFTRLLGSVHTKKLMEAKSELKILNRLHDTLVSKDTYQANQVEIQINSGKAWIRLKEGKKDEALKLMNLAADLEDKTGKHPVTPGEVIPARELLGNMLLEINEPTKALKEYEVNLKSHPNRFNALYGAGLAAEKSGNAEKAKLYFGQLLTITGKSASDRIELTRAKNFLNQ